MCVVVVVVVVEGCGGVRRMCVMTLIFYYKSNVMHYYNAKSKVIMKRIGIEFLSGEQDALLAFGGSRGVRRGGQAVIGVLGGGKRTFRKRTCRSKSRCGGSSWSSSKYFFLGGRRSRGVRRSRSRRGGGRVLAYDDMNFLHPY